MPDISRPRRFWKHILYLFLLLIIVASSCLLWTMKKSGNIIFPKKELRVASQKGASYREVLSYLVDYVNDYPDGIDFRILVQPVDSIGSLQTIKQIEADEVDIGLIQGNAIVESTNVRACLQIYPEVYLFFSHDKDTSLQKVLENLHNRGLPIKIASLGQGSQTYEDLFKILQFYGIEPKDIEHKSLSYEESSDAIKSGKVDIAFFVAGAQNSIIRSLAKEPGIYLCPLAQRDALIQKIPGLSEHDVIEGAFYADIPSAKIETIMAPSVLVVNRRLDDYIVYKLTDYLLRKKVNLHRGMPQIMISELTDNNIELHKGAEKAVHRDIFWAIKEYDAFLKFVVSLLALLISFFGLIISMAMLVITIKRDKQNRNITAISTGTLKVDQQHTTETTFQPISKNELIKSVINNGSKKSKRKGARK